ncbi:MAG: HIT domain-containing protein [Aquiluna sp.]|nr:HIT domain-containing protein [Aquiluna sp.]
MDCIFCKIVAGDFGTELLGENEVAIAFRDINPQAKVHILVVPKQHTSNIGELESNEVLTGLFSLIRQISTEQTDGQFRLQFNTGEREGQSVFHTHAHILSQQAA